MAPSDRLGTIRVVVVLCALANVVFHNFNLLAQAAGSWYQPEGVMTWFPGTATEFLFSSGTALLVLKALLILFLISALVGFRTYFSLLVSTILYTLYLGTLRANSWSLSNGILPLYLLFILIWVPCGEAFSVDQLYRREYAHLKLDDRPSVAMGWSVFLVRAVIAFSFFLSGISKFQNTGPGWIHAWRFRQFVLEDSLTFSHLGWVPHLLAAPRIFWLLLAAAYLGFELFFPLILLVRDLRVIYLFAGVILRSFVLLPQNIFFHDLILLQFVFYDWDRILPLRQALEQDRRKKVSLFPFKNP